MILAAFFIFAALGQLTLRNERCGADYYHRPHEWRESADEIHECDGGSDEVDELDQQAQQDALYERGVYS